MKKMIFAVMLVAIIASMLPAGTVFAGEAVTYELIAGQSVDVGSVTVSDDGTNLIVEYNIDVDGWFIVKAHLYADKKAPKKAAPGNFPFHSEPIHATSYTFTIPLAELGVESGEDLFIATHALVNNENNILGYMDAEGNMYAEQAFETVCPTLGDIAAALPELPTGVTVQYSNGLFTFIVEEGPLAGTYTGYCIDNGHYIWPQGYGGLNGDYEMNMYSSYEPLPESITTAYDQFGQKNVNPNIDNPENLPLVNWVINNRDGFNDTEVQHVIWNLVDDEKPALTAHEKELFDAATVDADADGIFDNLGFVPANGEQLAIILQPVDPLDNTNGQVTIGQVTIGQVTFASLGLACVDVPLYDPIFQEETGWAIPEGGTAFRQGWGSYFTFTP